MTTPSFRDVVQLSAFLDRQLSQAEKARLEIRIQSDPALAATLADLRQARSVLRRTPHRRIPRNFTLTPKMAGIKPPVPRAVPALGWASAMAMVLFVLTLGTNLLGQFSFRASAPMIAAAPMTNPGYGLGGGEAATQSPGNDTTLVTPTPEPYSMTVPEPTPLGKPRIVEPPVAATKGPAEPVNFWPYIWLGLAGVLGGTALLVRRASVRAFHRKVGSKRNP
jgi:hypothetical protein